MDNYWQFIKSVLTEQVPCSFKTDYQKEIEICKQMEILRKELKNAISNESQL